MRLKKLAVAGALGLLLPFTAASKCDEGTNRDPSPGVSWEDCDAEDQAEGDKDCEVNKPKKPHKPNKPPKRK